MEFGAGSADVPLAILKGILGLIAVVGGLLKFVDVGKQKREAKMRAVPPTPLPPPAQLPTNPFGHIPPPTDPALLLRLDRMQVDAERQHLELRRTFAEEARRMLAEQTRALMREREARRRAELLVAGKEQQLHTLQAALERTETELARAQTELLAARERERAAAAAIPAPDPIDTKVTPLRPPRRT